MLMIEHVTRENAEGMIKDVYSRISEQFEIPAPFKAMSASPGVFGRHAGILDYFMNHDALEFHMLAAIRYIVSNIKGYTPCIDFNSKLLCAVGLTEEELVSLKDNPLNAPFEERECMLLDFVRRGIVEPESVLKTDIERLKSYGWRESDLVDAIYHGASMDIGGNLVNVFSD